MFVILAKSPFTLNLMPPIFTEGVSPQDEGIYYEVDDSEIDRKFIPNDCIICIKQISIEDSHKLIHSYYSY